MRSIGRSRDSFGISGDSSGIYIGIPRESIGLPSESPRAFAGAGKGVGTPGRAAAVLQGYTCRGWGTRWHMRRANACTIGRGPGPGESLAHPDRERFHPRPGESGHAS
eukprot:9478793-Pyramimonas_sp.AAC.1